MKTILVPIDFSRGTGQVVAEATALARKWQARMLLLNVTRPGAVLSDHEQLLELVEHCFARRSHGSEAPPRVSGDSLGLIGEPVRVILEQAARIQPDYIVMGTHGRTNAPDRAIGRTAAGVIKGAGCPVLLVPSARPAARGDETPAAVKRGEEAPPMEIRLRKRPSGRRARRLGVRNSH